MIWAILGVFVVLTLLDLPIVFSLALALALGLAIASDIPLFVVAHKMATGIDSFVLLAIPLYILAGSLMETGGRKEVLMMVPVVFLILPVTVVFALFPGLAALRIGL